jgi:prepilin-type N-terminal cleavage/methylation domain-containing protein
MKRRSTPFTLIELLVVIGIIAILAGILLPTISIAIRKTNVAKARTEMTSLITAIAMYQSEYDVMPFAYGAPDSVKLTDDNYKTLIAFLSQTKDPAETSATGDARMRAGNARRLKILEVVKPGLFLDPWDNPYHIVYDSNYNGSIAVNDTAQTPGLVHSETTIPRSILIYSDGPDGATHATRNNEDNQDNVYSVDTVWDKSLGHVIQ